MSENRNVPMTATVQDIILDVNQDYQPIRVSIRKGSENTHLWRFCLVDDGVPIDLSAVKSASFVATKPSGSQIWNPCVIRENAVEYTVTGQTTAEAGVMTCMLELCSGHFDKQGNLVVEMKKTAPFTVTVLENVFDDDTKLSTVETQSFTELEANVGALNDKFPIQTDDIGEEQVTTAKLASHAVTPEETSFIKQEWEGDGAYGELISQNGSSDYIQIVGGRDYMLFEYIRPQDMSRAYITFTYTDGSSNRIPLSNLPTITALVTPSFPYDKGLLVHTTKDCIRLGLEIVAAEDNPDSFGEANYMVCAVSSMSTIPDLVLNGSQVSNGTLPESALTAAVQQKLNDKAVNTGNIVDNAVTTAKLADGAVATQKLEDGAVTMAKLASEVTDAIEAGGEIADGAVTPEKTSFITDMEWTVKGGIGTIYFNSGGSGLAVTGGRDYLLFENISLTEEKLSMLTLTVTDESGAVLDTYALASLAVISTGDMTYDHGRYIHMPPKAVKMVISITPPEDDPDTCFDVDYTVCSLNTILSIPYLEVGTNNLRDGSVTSDKLETGTVTMAKLGTDVKEALSGALKREIVPALPSTDGSVLAMRTLPYTGRNMTNSNLITTNWISLDAVSDLSPVTDAKRIKMTVTLTSTDGQIAVYSGGEIRLRYHGADGNKMTCPLSGISWQEGDNQLDIPLTRFTPANSPSWSNIDEITVFTYGANQAGSYSITVSDLRIVDASVGIDPHTIYLVPSAVPETENVYNEYMYINYQWEQIGSTAVDLSGYYTKTESDDKLSEKVNIYDLVNGMYTVPDAQYAVHAVDAGADGNGNNIAETYATKTEMETKLAALEVRLATLEGDGV